MRLLLVRKHVTASAPRVRAGASYQASRNKILDWIWHHWHIENRLHCVRDVVFGGPPHRTRRQRPHLVASFRNPTIGILRSHGQTNITAAHRHYA